MNALSYIARAHGGGEAHLQPVSVGLVTNFTDDALRKLLMGVSRAAGLEPDIHAVPYKQYPRTFKGLEYTLSGKEEVVFVWLDVSTYVHSEFVADQTHLAEVLGDLAVYAQRSASKFVVNTLPIPSWGPYGNLFNQHELYARIMEGNQYLSALAQKHPNVHLVDIDRLVRECGECRARDLRNLYAFDVPFSLDFMLEVVLEWSAYLRSITGGVRKCLVLDLDNTLWGGVVGEVGPLGIALGPGYPGYAYQNFQHAVRTLYTRGVILAINSRNNAEDVEEVFASNPNMVLGKEYFASIQTNWLSKAENLVTISEELNIGLDSMVFLDDDPVNRDHVRTVLPMVSVPDLPTFPEAYIRVLYGIRDFHQLSLTDEDREKGRMYAEERVRSETRSVLSMDEYVRSLGIEVTVGMNERVLLPRLSQLSLKTNQFNLTTRRYTEDELAACMDAGGYVFSGTVTDRFGSYGMVVEAVIRHSSPDVAELESYLMSCRTMGRMVEFAFLDHVLGMLVGRGVRTLHASFIPTKKNAPAAEFLRDMGFVQVPSASQTGFCDAYVLDVATYMAGERAQLVRESGILLV